MAFGEIGLAPEVERFSGLSKGLEFQVKLPVQFKDFTWVLKYADPTDMYVTFDPRRNLFFAAMDLAVELLDRFPGAHDPYLLARWKASAEQLGHAGDQLLLWPKLHPYIDELKSLRRTLIAALKRALNLLPSPGPPVADELAVGSPLATWPALCEFFDISAPESEICGTADPWKRPSWRGDPADDLASWPLPRVIRQTGFPAENLLELPVLFAGALLRMVELNGNAKRTAMNLIVFPQPTSPRRPMRSRLLSDEVFLLKDPGRPVCDERHHQRVRLVSRPDASHGFSKEIEGFIGEAAKLKC